MSNTIDLPTYSDNRGKLTVIENCLPFDVKRIYFIYEVSSLRGGHRHKKTTQAFVCLNGSCEVFVNDGETKNTFTLDSPTKALIVKPQDWHTMDNFTKGSILVVFASEYYDESDYIHENYK